MWLSEIYLVVIALILLVALKCPRSMSVPKLLACSLPLVLLDGGAHWSFSFAVYREEDLFIRIMVLLSGTVLTYVYKHIKQQIVIVFIVLGAMFVSSANDMIFLMLSIEFMIVPTYFLLYDAEKNHEEMYLKYNMLACVISIFAVGLLCSFGVSNFGDIRYLFSFIAYHNKPVLLITSCFIIAFSIRMGLFLNDRYFDKNVNFELLAPIFCISLPMCSLIFFRVISNVFYHAYINDVLEIVSCVAMCYASFAIYKSIKINELLVNYAIYNAGVVFLLSATKTFHSVRSMMFMILSEMLTMLGFLLSFSLIRKRFNKPIEYLRELASLATEHRDLKIGISMLLLCIANFPPSIGFLSRFCLYLAAFEAGAFGSVAILICTSILLMICSAKIITRMWKKDTTEFLGIINQKLIHIICLIAIVNWFVLPLAYGIDFLRGEGYVSV